MPGLLPLVMPCGQRDRLKELIDPALQAEQGPPQKTEKSYTKDFSQSLR